MYCIRVKQKIFIYSHFVLWWNVKCNINTLQVISYFQKYQCTPMWKFILFSNFVNSIIKFTTNSYFITWLVGHDNLILNWCFFLISLLYIHCRFNSFKDYFHTKLIYNFVDVLPPWNSMHAWYNWKPLYRQILLHFQTWQHYLYCWCGWLVYITDAKGHL